MKITNLGSAGINPYQREMKKAEEAKTAAGKTSDKIEISSEALQLREQQVDPSRQKKVQEIKAQIENGTYEINPQQIAVSLYNYHLKNK